VATFYPYLPDLSIAQVMFLAGLTIAILGALALPHGPGVRWLRRPAAVITTALRTSAGLPEAVLRSAPTRQRPSGAIVPLAAPVQAAARRFAALPAPTRHAWLVQHLAALRARRITLAQLP
jgi:hypothetical protein